ncbi:hypothetical protein FF1_021964 [Malus domestica]
MSQMPLDEDLNLDLSPIFDHCLESSCPIYCENYSGDCLVNLDLPPEFDRSPYGTYHVCCQSSCVVQRNVDMESCLIIKKADYKEFVKLKFHDLMMFIPYLGPRIFGPWALYLGLTLKPILCKRGGAPYSIKGDSSPHSRRGKRAKPKKAKRSSHYIQERPHTTEALLSLLFFLWGTSPKHLYPYTYRETESTTVWT